MEKINLDSSLFENNKEGRTCFLEKPKQKENLFVAFCDSSFASESKSRSRYGYFFCIFGALVSWTSSHSTRILTSSTEAECHALIHTEKENRWEKEFLQELTIFEEFQTTVIFQDNKSAIRLT